MSVSPQKVVSRWSPGQDVQFHSCRCSHGTTVIVLWLAAAECSSKACHPLIRAAMPHARLPVVKRLGQGMLTWLGHGRITGHATTMHEKQPASTTAGPRHDQERYAADPREMQLGTPISGKRHGHSSWGLGLIVRSACKQATGEAPMPD